MHIYEVGPLKDKGGVDLISDVLPFGRLWYAEPLVKPSPSYLIDLKLFLALTNHDIVRAPQNLAQARSSSGIWSLPANQQAIEAMDTAVVYFPLPRSAVPSDLTKVIRERDVFYMPSLAAVAMCTEQKEVALDALVTSFRSRYVIDLTQMWTPIFYPLRTEPRFHVGPRCETPRVLARRRLGRVLSPQRRKRSRVRGTMKH